MIVNCFGWDCYFVSFLSVVFHFAICFRVELPVFHQKICVILFATKLNSFSKNGLNMFYLVSNFHGHQYVISWSHSWWRWGSVCSLVRTKFGISPSKCFDFFWVLHSCKSWEALKISNVSNCVVSLWIAFEHEFLFQFKWNLWVHAHLGALCGIWPRIYVASSWLSETTSTGYYYYFVKNTFISV